MSPEEREFWRRREQSNRDLAANFWRDFERAALYVMQAGVVEMRLAPEDFMRLKWAMPREVFPDERRANGDILLFGRMWVGEAST